MDLLEYYHTTGKCPDWAYYQLNGKTAQENYQEQKQRRHKALQDALDQRRREEELIQKEVQERLEETVAAALEDIFKGFMK